jgi:hypothetical protein
MVLVPLFIHAQLYSQVEFTIDTLMIEYLKVPFDENVWDEAAKDGPYLFIEYLLVNSTDTIITINMQKASIIFSFVYEERKYWFDLTKVSHWESHNILQIEPEKSVNCCAGTHLFLGTPIYKEKKEDYTKEFKSILPTLKFKFVHRDICVETSKIKNIRYVKNK